MKNPIFEVNESDIEALNDEKLTELVARLCKADVTRAGQSTSCVRHGGNINTPDDGLDIVVEWKIEPPDFSHLPRKTIGIQIKKPDMPASSISVEMGKNVGEGKSINRLIDNKGAYIIVSSGRSCNDRQLRNREAAMSKAVSRITGNEDLQLVFYDAQAIVNWVNEYPGVIIWVRNIVGRPLNGWQPYGDWAFSGSVEEYFLDDKKRFMLGFSEHGTTVIDGIHKIREKLSIPGSSVRLVGLSGVGKTRLIQALFESTVGVDSLPEHLACYTNFNDYPIYDTLELVRMIKADAQRIVLIVDDCSGKDHNTLVNNIQGSQISLITVEYDVEEDLPRDTQVYLLEPASEEVLFNILTKRHPDIDNRVVERIVNLSEGNSRVALALVENYKVFGDFGTLRDNEIIRRLFWQNKDESGDLFKTAQACSLVYSFNSSEPDRDESEIPLLALLLGQLPEVYFKNIFEIKKKKLLQSRGSMAALLPQAVANRIASDCLGSITKSTLESVFLAPGASRLLKSFCHRLSFLHENYRAREIAKDWLNPSGIFGIKELTLNNEDRISVSYLLPIDLQVSLEYFRRLLELLVIIPDIKQYSTTINWIVRSLLDLAYFPDYFENTMGLLEKMLLMDDITRILEEGVNQQIDQLFWPIFSRTTASPKAKHEHVSLLLRSDDFEILSLGVRFLNSSLETQFHTVLWVNSFGARSLSLGRENLTYKEIRDWLASAMQILLVTYTSNPLLKSDLRHIIENKFTLLWNFGNNCDQLKNLVEKINEDSPWPEIWVEIKKTLHWNEKHNNKILHKSLIELEEMTRPKSLEEELKIYLPTSGLSSYPFEDSSENEGNRSLTQAYESKMRELGKRTAKNLQILNRFGPDLFTFQNYWLNPFVEGVTQNTKDLVLLWEILRDNYKRASSQSSIGIFVAFFKTLQTSNPDLAELFRKEIIEDPDLFNILPSILIYKPNISTEIETITNMINKGSCSPNLFWGFGDLKIGDQIFEQDFCKIITSLAGTREGYSTVIMVLQGKFEDYRKNGIQIPLPLLQLGQTMLFRANELEFVDWNDPMRDLYIESIVTSLPKSSFSTTEARRFISELFPDGFEKSFSSAYHPHINNFFGSEYPIELLDLLYTRIGLIDQDENFHLLNYPEEIGEILQHVNKDIILRWMKEDLHNRSQFLSRYLPLVEEDEETKVFKWTDFGRLFVSLTQDVPRVLENIGFRLEPRSWTGSYSYAIRRRLPLIDDDLINSTSRLIRWRENTKLRWLKQSKKHDEIDAEYNERTQAFEP